MRIISGKYKGKHFGNIKKLKARPTTDRAKESLFNILNNIIDFEEVKMLDLFSGTGSISYEFASRGCDSITCIDRDFNHIRFIKKTSEELDFGLNVIKADVFKFLKASSNKYDVIFADPPFAMGNFEDIPKLVKQGNFLLEDGLLIVEHSDKFIFKETQPEETRAYGKVCFSFFRFNEDK